MRQRKKFYFIDYSDKIKLSRRVHKTLINSIKRGMHDIALGDIIKSLKWSAGVFNQNIKPRMSLDAKLYSILRSLDILVQLKLLVLEGFSQSGNNRAKIESILEKNNEHKLAYSIKVQTIKSPNAFDAIVNASAFSPITGTKQELTEEMREYFAARLSIDYKQILNGVISKKQIAYKECVDAMKESIQENWINSYQKTCTPNIKDNISIFKNNGFTTLFDSAYERFESLDILADSFIEDRTIGTFGYSRKPKNSRRRNDYFMRYDESRNWSDKETDRGHFLAHSIGGSIYTNIFPQSSNINRGRTKEGIKYREMERYLSKNQNIFCFVRPIYFDFSIRPYLIEFGYITRSYDVYVELFDNV